MSLTRAGVPSAVISVPNRYMHSPNEIVDLTDLEATAELIAAIARRFESGAAADVTGHLRGVPSGACAAASSSRGPCSGVVIVGMVVAWGRTHDSTSLNPPMLTQELKPVKLRGPAPDFSGTTLTGDKLSSASLAGKPAVIDFFSTWCAPCKQEASGLGQIAAEYRGRVHFVAVDLDDTSQAAATAFATKHGWDFPVIWDPGDKLPGRFQVAGKPSMVIIDRQGRLVLLVPGPHMLGEYRAAIDKVLSE